MHLSALTVSYSSASHSSTLCKCLSCSSFSVMNNAVGYFIGVTLVNTCITSGGWVPMGQGAATAITPQGRRTPTGLQTRNPAIRLPALICSAPHYSTHHTEARSPVEVKCTNPWNKGEKKSRERGEDLKRKVWTIWSFVCHTGFRDPKLFTLSSSSYLKP